MKKIYAVILAAVLLAGCAALYAAAPSGAMADGGGISVVATIFPEYDWAREIVGGVDGVELTMLLDNGVDLHSFQPTADDMIKISTCDVFIFVGGESDLWVNDALATARNRDIKVVDLLDVLGEAAREEEQAEGMEADHGHDGDNDEHGYDEHVWLSLRNAGIFADAIAGALGEADPANAEKYAENARAYIEKLDDLDGRYAHAVEAGSKDTLLFGDRFPFRYLVEDYGLKYYAAFAGCSAETEASFGTIVFLAGKVDELGLHTVLTIEGGDGRIAETIVANTAAKDQTVAALDSMQGTTSRDAEGGATYLSIMEKNLETISSALR